MLFINQYNIGTGGHHLVGFDPACKITCLVVDIFM